MCVCVRVVESNCALCVCACRALSQVEEVADDEKGGRVEAFCRRSYGIESICDTARDE